MNYYSDDWQVLQERVWTGGDFDPTRMRIDRQYVWGTRGLDDLILRDRDASQPPNGILDERLHALADGTGHVVSLYRVNPGLLLPRIAERIGYAPYGQAHFMDGDFAARTASAHDWNILFGGYYYDPETGLYHVRNRFYDPNLGRFLQIELSRNTVRAIVREQGAMPDKVRKDKIHIEPELLARLYKECDGWIQRIHEKLLEEEKIQVSYSTLTRLVRQLHLASPAMRAAIAFRTNRARRCSTIRRFTG